MSSYLCALTADGGVPLFTRRTGDLPALPFATVGVLNGVHMFTHLRGSELQSAVTPEEKIVWQVYHKSIVLILVTRNDACSSCHLLSLLDNIFASMIMLVGVNHLLNPPNVEKLKRELKVCYPLIDGLLNQRDEENFTVSDLTQRVDVLLSYESQVLLNQLEKFLEVADSAYGCLFINRNIVVASKQWWSLTPQELVLISAHVHSLPKSTCHETPIFLPTTCPQTSNRLLTLQLLGGIELCALCENTPTLAFLEQEASKIWKGSFELLQSVSIQHPRNFPSNIILDKNILGVLLINNETNVTISSLLPTDHDIFVSKEEKASDLTFRQEALRTLYKQVVGTHFNDSSWVSSTRNKTETSTVEKEAALATCMNEFYLSTERHKGYAVNSPPYQIFIVFNRNVPHYALRPVSHKTLKSLTAKKLMPKHT